MPSSPSLGNLGEKQQREGDLGSLARLFAFSKSQWGRLAVWELLTRPRSCVLQQSHGLCLCWDGRA